MMQHFIKTRIGSAENVNFMYVNELNQYHPHDGLVNDMADTLHFQPRGYKYDTPIAGKLYSDVTGLE